MLLLLLLLLFGIVLPVCLPDALFVYLSLYLRARVCLPACENFGLSVCRASVYVSASLCYILRHVRLSIFNAVTCASLCVTY